MCLVSKVGGKKVTCDIVCYKVVFNSIRRDIWKVCIMGFRRA